VGGREGAWLFCMPGLRSPILTSSSKKREGGALSLLEVQSWEPAGCSLGPPAIDTKELVGCICICLQLHCVSSQPSSVQSLCKEDRTELGAIPRSRI
jgi:hypothetical protein